MSAVPVSPPEGPVTRATVEAKLREIRGEVDATAESARGTLVAVAVVGVVALAGVAFLIGRRRGRKRRTVVEVKRV